MKKRTSFLNAEGERNYLENKKKAREIYKKLSINNNIYNNLKYSWGCFDDDGELAAGFQAERIIDMYGEEL